MPRGSGGGSQPGDGDSDIPLVKDRRCDHVRHCDRALDIWELGVLDETVPEQTVSLRLWLCRGADSVTVRGALCINPVIAERVSSVELNTLHHVRRQRRNARQFVCVHVLDQRDPLHGRERKKTGSQNSRGEHPLQQGETLFPSASSKAL